MVYKKDKLSTIRGLTYIFFHSDVLKSRERYKRTIMIEISSELELKEFRLLWEPLKLRDVLYKETNVVISKSASQTPGNQWTVI